MLDLQWYVMYGKSVSCLFNIFLTEMIVKDFFFFFFIPQ